MAKKRSTSKKRATRKPVSKRKGNLNLGKFTLGLLILVGLGYGYLAIKEGKLVPDSISEFEMPAFNTQKEPVTKSAENPVNEIKEEKPFDYEAFDLYFTKAFDFMWPAYETGQAIIERPYYTIRYSEEHEQALWVSYKLVSDSLKQQKFKRPDNFRTDPRVRTGSADLKDYENSGYDRGHLAPAADFSYDEFALSQSFYMSNISPQIPAFNRGVWRKLEDRTRQWALKNSELYVVTGPILNKKGKTIGKNEVTVPEYYYKILLDVHKPEIKAIAFLMKNEKSSAKLSTFVVPIDSIEQLTNLDFFPNLPDELENQLEANVFSEKWF